MNDEAVYRTAPATPGLLKKMTVGQRASLCELSLSKGQTPASYAGTGTLQQWQTEGGMWG